MKKTIMIILIVCLISVDAFAFPLYINRQGVLRNATNGSLMNGTFLFNISFYKQSDNSLQYTEEENITSVNGVYNYIIGRRLSLNPAIFLNDLYINASINNISYQTVNFTTIPYSIYSLYSNYSNYANNSNYLGGVIAASYATQAWVNLQSYTTLPTVVASIGNWSANQSNYVPYEGATRTLNLNFQNITNAGNITADAGNDICVASGYCLSDFTDYYTKSEIVTNNNTFKSWAQSTFQNDSEVDTKLGSYWNSSIASTANTTLKTWIQSTFQNDSEVDAKLGSYINNSLLVSNNNSIKIFTSASYVNRTNWTTHDDYPAACGAGLCIQTIGDTSTCINPVASSDSTWTLHNSYPAACGANNYATTIGDTLTCAVPDVSNLAWTNDWMIAYSNTVGLQELALNTGSGQYLKSNGEAAPTWGNPTGTNDSHLHNAANITTGTFGTGVYTFQNNVTFNQNITVTQCIHFASGGKICSG